MARSIVQFYMTWPIYIYILLHFPPIFRKWWISGRLENLQFIGGVHRLWSGKHHSHQFIWTLRKLPWAQQAVQDIIMLLTIQTQKNPRRWGLYLTWLLSHSPYEAQLEAFHFNAGSSESTNHLTNTGTILSVFSAFKVQPSQMTLRTKDARWPSF